MHFLQNLAYPTPQLQRWTLDRDCQTMVRRAYGRAAEALVGLFGRRPLPDSVHMSRVVHAHAASF